MSARVDILVWLEKVIRECEDVAREAEFVSPSPWTAGRGEDAAVTHIAGNDPTSVLRRCAADRKLLELHRPMDHEGEMAVFCSECDVSGDYPYFPCATLRILAEGYGWSAQTSLAVDQGQTPPIEGDQVT